MANRKYPFMIIDSEMNTITLHGDEIEIKKILDVQNRIKKHTKRIDLQHTIGQWLNGKDEPENNMVGEPPTDCEGW